MPVKSLSEIPTWNNTSNAVGKTASRVSLWQGDITQLQLDAIANAANSHLSGGLGVNGAIQKAAGRELLEHCQKLNGCPTGSAVLTPGFRLPAKHIIHCVGPTNQDESLLASTYRKALEICSQQSLKSVAFPCISTGIYGFPNLPAAEIAIRTVLDYLKKHEEIERVIFCVFLDTDDAIYRKLLDEYLGE